MATADEKSYIYKRGTTPVTRTALSTRAKIMAFSADAEGSTSELTQVGVISEFSPSHSRTIETRRGLGFGDRIAELIPQNAEAVTISITRTMLYLSNIMQAFGYKAGSSGIVRSLAHHRFPFDIRHELVLPEYITNYGAGSSISDSDNVIAPLAADNTTATIDDAGERAILTIYEGCWFSDYSVTYSVDDVIVTENCTLTASDVYASEEDSIASFNDTMGNASNSTSPFSNRFDAVQTSTGP